MTEEEASDVIRSRVLAGSHGGHLRPGDRLPTYREVAGQTGLDLRSVARIYRALEDERLVEVGDAYAGRLRGVRADDRDAIARLDRARPILISIAARERLEGVELPPRVATRPAIAPESSEELSAVLMRLNLDALETVS